MAKAQFVHEIKREDVGKYVIKIPRGGCEVCGAKPYFEVIRTAFMGGIMPGDVGKRIYKVGEHYSVENVPQMQERLKREGRACAI